MDANVVTKITTNATTRAQEVGGEGVVLPPNDPDPVVADHSGGPWVVEDSHRDPGLGAVIMDPDLGDLGTELEEQRSRGTLDQPHCVVYPDNQPSNQGVCEGAGVPVQHSGGGGEHGKAQQ